MQSTPCGRGGIIDVQEFNKAKAWAHFMGSQIRDRLKNIAGYIRLRKQKLILVRHGDLITMYNNVVP